MRTVRLTLHVPERTARDAYELLCDFERYPGKCEAVRSVVVSTVGDDVTTSRWEVTFRAGLLRWTEEDRFDRDALTIVFRQLDGDMALFDGTWQVADTAGGSEIAFTARLDMGIPSLADALEPIAVRTLIDNTVSVVTSLFGTATLVASEAGVAEPAVARS
jgi:ribosome-associated toxin RatA of RatAB toxin-antitoxin module